MDYQGALFGPDKKLPSNRLKEWRYATKARRDQDPDPGPAKPEAWLNSKSGTYRQLPMFLSAHEIYHHLNMIDQTWDETRPELMTSKYQEASARSVRLEDNPAYPDEPAKARRVVGPSLVEHLKSRQFELDRPLPIGIEDDESNDYEKNSVTLNNGHHRVAVALAHVPDLPLPVQLGPTFGSGEGGHVATDGWTQETHDFSHLPDDPTGEVPRYEERERRRQERAARGLNPFLGQSGAPSWVDLTRVDEGKATGASNRASNPPTACTARRLV